MIFQQLWLSSPVCTKTNSILSLTFQIKSAQTQAPQHETCSPLVHWLFLCSVRTEAPVRPRAARWPPDMQPLGFLLRCPAQDGGESAGTHVLLREVVRWHPHPGGKYNYSPSEERASDPKPASMGKKPGTMPL